MIPELSAKTDILAQPVVQSMQPLSLQQIFSRPQLNAMELLAHNNLMEELKKDSSLFTNLLIKHSNSQKITKEMFNIIIRPQKIANLYNVAPTSQNFNALILNQKITYRCIEVLTNQDDQFLIFMISKTKKQIKQNEPNNKKIKVQSKETTKIIEQQNSHAQNNQKTESVSLLDYLFSLLQQQNSQLLMQQQNSVNKSQLQETSLAYFAKIIQQFLYNKASLIMKYLYNLESKQLNEKFQTKPIKKIINHVYSRSISQLLNRIFQAQGKDQEFYIKQKIETFVYIQKSIQNQIQMASSEELTNQDSCQLIQACLQNFNSFVQNFSDKCQDRYQKTRYLQLLKQLMSYQMQNQSLQEIKDQNKSNIITYLAKFLEGQNLMINSLIISHQEKNQTWIKNYLKYIFQNIIKILTSLITLDECFHRIPKEKSINQGNMSNKKKFDTSQQSLSQVNSYDLKIESQILLQIQKNLISIFNHQTKELFQKQKQQQKCQKQLWDYIQEQPIVMVTYFQLFKSIMMVTLSINFFSTKSSIQRLFQLIEINEQKNILHNVIKDVLLFYLKHQQKSKLIQFFFKSTQGTLEQESIILKHIIKNIQKGARKSYDIHITQVGKLLISKIQIEDLENPKYIQNFQTLKTLINSKNDFYNKIIGCDPRKASESWGDDSSELVFAGEFQNYQKPNVNILEQKQQILGNLNSDIKMQNSDFIQTNQNHWVEDEGVALDSQHSLSEDNSLSKDQKLMNEFNLKNAAKNQSNEKDNSKFQKILNDQLSLNFSLSFNQEEPKDKQLSTSKQMQKQWLKLTKLNEIKSSQKSQGGSLQSIAMKFKNSSMEFDISEIADELQKL